MPTPSPYNITYGSHQSPAPSHTSFEDQHALCFASQIFSNSDPSHPSTGNSLLPWTPSEIGEPTNRSGPSQCLSSDAPFSFDGYLFAANNDFAFFARSFNGTDPDSHTFANPPRGPLEPWFVPSCTQHMTGNTASSQKQLPQGLLHPQPANDYMNLSPVESTFEVDRVLSCLDVRAPPFQLQLQELETTASSSFTSTQSTEPEFSPVSCREAELESSAASQDARALQSRLQCEHCDLTFSDSTAFNRHTKTHQKPYKCDHPSIPPCPWAFKLEKDLRRHKQTHNVICTTEMQIREGKFYLCDHRGCQYAAKGFLRRDNLLRHMRNVHGVDDGRLEAGSTWPQARVSRGRKT